MGFANNSKLVTSAAKISIAADDAYGSVYSGTSGADAFMIEDGVVGVDVLVGFGSNDSLIAQRKLASFAIDGSQTFDIRYEDHVSEEVAQLILLGTGEKLVTGLRYLGAKDGGFVYADSATRDRLFGDTSVSQAVRMDNIVESSSIDMTSKSVAFLTDNALGLNFGGDTITGFGDDDLLIFTTKLMDRAGGDGRVEFGRNLVLDVSGANGPLDSDPKAGPGGQMDLYASGQKSVYFLGEKTIDGHTYYYYGSAHAALPDGVVYAS